MDEYKSMKKRRYFPIIRIFIGEFLILYGNIYQDIMKKKNLWKKGVKLYDNNSYNSCT